MRTDPVTSEVLGSSVIAVPPLARDAAGKLSREPNEALIRHLEEGGISTLLYGGNANLYHIRPSEYGELLDLLADCAGPGTTVVPAAGPAYGMMMDQVEVLREREFPTVMVLPQTGVCTDEGVQTGLRRFAERLGKPIVVYLKEEGYLQPSSVQALVEDGLVSWVKYAIVREDPAKDDVLRELVDLVDPNLVVSGIGEQPAIVHLRDFGVVGFTSGCVCLAPGRSMEMLRGMKAGDWDGAEQIRKTFSGLEDLRNEINPIRVLHEAVGLAGIAEMGPVQPLLSGLSGGDTERVRDAAQSLCEWDA